MNKKAIYLDYASATPVDERVLSAMLPYFSEKFGNSSSIHAWGQEARQALVEARDVVAEVLNCESSEVVFTSGGTESINFAIKGVAEAYASKGKHIISSRIEHKAGLGTLEQLEEKGYEVTYVGVSEEGFVNIDHVSAAIRPDTVLVSIMYANNEMGAIQPIREIGELTRKRGVIFHTDACHAAMSLCLDVEELKVDLMSLNASKIYGPKGVGVLYLRNGVEIVPQIDGGGQEDGLRGGTENVPGIVGLKEALRLAWLSKDVESERLAKLRDELIRRMEAEIDGVCLNGPREMRLPNNLNVSFFGVEGESMLLRLDMEKIAASSGSACTSNDLEPSHVLRAMGLNDERIFSSLRFSLGRDTSESDIEEIMARIKKVVSDLRKIS